MDRSDYPTKLTRLHDVDDVDDYRRLTPSQRVAMVWQLTLDAWAWKEGSLDEPRSHRHVVRVLRGRR